MAREWIFKMSEASIKSVAGDFERTTAYGKLKARSALLAALLPFYQL